MAFRLFQLVISCKPQPAIEKTGQMASQERFRRDAEQTGQKTGRPGKNGRLATLAGGAALCGFNWITVTVYVINIVNRLLLHPRVTAITVLISSNLFPGIEH